MKLHAQNSIHASPWNRKEQAGMILWVWVWRLFCSWTPQPWNKWRLFWLRAFGATLEGRPFVHQRARIQVPWNLIMRDRACLGDRAQVYSLDRVELGAGSTVAQECYLCTGTHDLENTMFLMTGPIIVGAGAFLGARCFVLPDVFIGENAVIGAASVVTKNMPVGMICCGNPCRPLRRRLTGPSIENLSKGESNQSSPPS